MSRLSLFSLLCLLPLLCPACKAPDNVESYGADKVRGKVGRKLESRFESGQEVYELQAENGGIRVEVERVINNYRRPKIETKFKIFNRFDDEIRFSLGSCRLSYNGEEYTPKLLGFMRDLNPDIRAKSGKTYSWAFELPSAARGGIYDVTIRDISFYKAGKLTPIGQDLVFKLKVPGEKEAGANKDSG